MLLVRILTLVLLATAGVCAQQGSMPVEAIRLQRAGKLQEAVAAYRLFLKDHPGSLAARSNLAVALANLGLLDDAIQEYEKALELEPSNAAVQLNLAIAYYKQRRVPDAGRLLETLHAAQPGNEQVLLLYADCLYRLGEYKETIGVLGPLLKGKPEHLAGNYLTGMAHLRMQQAAEGQAFIDRVMKSAGEAESLYLVGATQFQAADYPAARDSLAKAVKLNPDLPGIHTYYAQALVETGDSSSAKASFQEALQRDPTDFEANLHYGALLRIEKETEAAAKHLTAAERLNPNSLAVQFQLANLDMETGKTEQAIPRLEKIVKESPAYREAHISLARAYYRVKRKEDGDRERAIIRELEAALQKKELKNP